MYLQNHVRQFQTDPTSMPETFKFKFKIFFIEHWHQEGDVMRSKAHYSCVIIGLMAFRITSLTIVYSNVYSDTDQSKHQSSASLTLVRGIHRWPVNFPHKGPVTRKCFHLMTSSWLWVSVDSGDTFTHFLQGKLPNQRAHDAIITSLWRQNDVATSFWRHNDATMASCVRWETPTQYNKAVCVCLESCCTCDSSRFRSLNRISDGQMRFDIENTFSKSIIYQHMLRI